MLSQWKVFDNLGGLRRRAHYRWWDRVVACGLWTAVGRNPPGPSVIAALDLVDKPDARPDSIWLQSRP
jgi:hypothetical protein